MPFKIFEILLPKSMAAKLHVKKESVILKTYNQSKTEQLGVCTVKLRHKNKKYQMQILCSTRR